MGPCGRMRPREGLVFPWHRPWVRLLKRTKYRMDCPSGVSTHGWLAHCPLLTCPMYCGFFAGWHDVFWPQSQQSFHCNKRVKWSQHNQQKWAQAVWPTGLSAAHMLPPVLSCGPATCCPFVALFCSDNSSKGVKETRFLLVSTSFLAQYGSGNL